MKLLFSDEAVSHGHVHREQHAGEIIAYLYDPFTQDRRTCVLKFIHETNSSLLHNANTETIYLIITLNILDFLIQRLGLNKLQNLTQLWLMPPRYGFRFSVEICCNIDAVASLESVGDLGKN